MKRLISVMLALALVLSLVGCGAKKANTPAQEPYEVRMIMPNILEPPGEEAVQKTEDTINDYLLNTLGITEFKLDLDVQGIFDMMNAVPLALAGKEEIDIIMIYNDLSTYVDNGYCLPLDDYFNNELKEGYEIVKDFMLSTYLDGHYYALPSWSAQVIDYRFIYNKDMVEGVYDMSNVDTWEEVMEAVEALKVAYPDEHFLAYADSFPSIYSMEDHTNLVGSYVATIGDSTEMVNYYATEAYRKACEKAYEMRQKGLLDPEGSANTTGHDTLTNTGSTKGVIMGHSLTEESVANMFNENNTYGATFDCVTFGRSDMVNPRFVWAIPYTSPNPSYAAQMLNLIWTDEFIFNTLGFGTEGVDYIWNEDHSMVTYPDSGNQLTVPYNCIYTLAGIGDQRMTWPATGGSTKDDLAFIDEEMANCFYPPTYGFTPSNADVATQFAAVSNVVTQYNTSLTYGDVDPAEYLPKFLADLEAAGINDIIDSYQKQFDEWKAQQ